MNVNKKVLVYSLSILSVSLVLWVFYLLNTNKILQKEYKQVNEKYEAIDGFLHIIQHDLGAARDSLRQLELEVEQLRLEVPEEN